ncbi:unnamed protein product [Ilex paraguariensis]|uniref:DUF4005 domain-containing protein n=1 Tax=Ilex paraguariensis TaxID=185542 RepID=A0ABC8UVU5_9AQUA
MARKKCLFNLLKRLFLSDTRSKSLKDKRRRWVFQKLKIIKSAPLSNSAPPPPSSSSSSLAPPSPHPSPSRERAVREAEEEQSTAQIATEVVCHFHQCEQEQQQFSVIDLQGNASLLSNQCERVIRDLAAIKIQSAYRGYLARKALRALKGLVRLQAIIRGRAVRRHAISTLKCLQSIVNIQSQVCARRFQKVEDTLHCHENKELQDFRDKDIKIDSNSQRRWDDSTLSKEEENALFLSKREAVLKRERINEYLFRHRRSTESEQTKVDERWKNWLEQWVESQFTKKEDMENLGTVFPSNARTTEEFGGRQLKLRNIQKQYQMAVMDSPKQIPRRSFHHRKQCFFVDDNWNTGSSPIPTYMAATESAKAKARSLSSPRVRGPISIDSPYKHKLSPISSINSEVTSSSKIGYPSGGFSQKSPCLKGHPSPVKSKRISKDLSLDSDCSLPNWDRLGVSRSGRRNNLL